MRVYFERSGGFTGMTLNVEVNTESLSSEEAKILQKRINDIDFQSMAGQDRPPVTRGADRFQYNIGVEKDNGKVHTLNVTDGNVPSELQPLLEYLQRKARQKRS